MGKLRQNNQNAASSGLYSSMPTQRVAIEPGASILELATPVRDMADAALWLAETLSAAGCPQLSGLYATVAHELYQLAGELAGVTGIKPSALGHLSDADYQQLMISQAAAARLILSQIKTAVVRLQARVDVGEGVIGADGKPVSVLNYLAGHMRSARRMLRDLAANKQWKERGEVDGDLTMRVMQVVRGLQQPGGTE